MRTRAELEAALYDSLVSFNDTACWGILRFAQHRHYLAEHLAAALDTEEKATAPAATATPAEPTGRLAALLAAIHLLGGRWTANTAARHYRNQLRHTVYGVPDHRIKALARADLAALATAGWLDQHTEPGRQYYELKKGGRP
ncbi:hypothetical protein ACVHNB_32640 [Streptomyces sp. YJ-C3]